MVQELVRDAKEMKEQLGAPSWVLVTGDIAFSAQPTQYEQARAWLDGLLEVVGAQADALLMVPGNHDVDRKLATTPAAKDAHASLRNNPAGLDDYLDHPGSLEAALWPKLRAYADFSKKYGGSPLTHERPFWTREARCDLGPVVFAGLNTALLSFDKQDSNINLALGKGQIYQAIHQAADGALVIVLQHHPPAWLGDGTDLTGALQKSPHLLFGGHVHDQNGCLSAPLHGGASLHFIGGAGHGDHAGGHGYAWVTVSRDSVDYYPRIWSLKQRTFRPASTDFPHLDADGRISIPAARLPEPLQAWLRPARASAEPSPADTSTSRPSPGAEYDTSRPYFFVPFAAKGEDMIDGPALIARVRETLGSSGRTAIGHAASFAGMGGIGKTQLAVEYAHAHRDEYPGGVYWFHADQDLDAQVARLALEARWVHPATEPALVPVMARQRLRTVERALFVFDNVERMEAIESLLPQAQQTCHVIMTSRLELPFPRVDLALFEQEQSLALLSKISGRRLDSEADHKAAARIHEQLDGLPLAVEIVAAYAQRRMQVTWVEIADRIARRKLEASSMRGEGFEHRSMTGHQANLRATLALDQELLGGRPELQRALDVLAWSAPSDMGRSLVHALVAPEDADALDDGLELVASLHILRRETEADSAEPRYRMHRLVQEVHRAERELDDETAAAFMTRLATWFESRRKDFARLPAYEAEMDHMQAWQERATALELPGEAARLLWLQAYPSYHRGHYAQARELVEHALEFLEASSDEHRELHAHLKNVLGGCWTALGQYARAEVLYMEALEVRRQELGERHPDTATSYGNLAAIYGHLRQYERALELNQQALEIRRQELGERHPDTVTSYGNLASIYNGLGQHERALELHQQALEIRRQELGERHPATATSYNNLASTYNDLGQHEQALELSQQALEIRRQELGERHPATATSYNNLAATYSHLGQHERAMQLSQQALEIRRQELGERHPATEMSYHRLARSYRELGQFEDALPLAKKVMAIQQQELGTHHPRTVTSVLNMAVLLAEVGQRIRAFQVVDKLLRSLPASHSRYKEVAQLCKNLQPDRGGFRAGAAKTSKKGRNKHKKRRH